MISTAMQRDSMLQHDSMLVCQETFTIETLAALGFFMHNK